MANLAKDALDGLAARLARVVRCVSRPVGLLELGRDGTKGRVRAGYAGGLGTWSRSGHESLGIK